MTFEKILLVQREGSSRLSLEQHLRTHRFSPTLTGSLSEAAGLLETDWYDLVFLDASLSESDPESSPANPADLLARIRQETTRRAAGPLVVMLAPAPSPSGAEVTRWMRLGAFDCLALPLAMAEVETTLQRAEQHAHLQQTAPYRQSAFPGAESEPGLLGNAVPTQQLRALVRKVATSEWPVLITGEAGTGKRRLARAIHAASARAGEPILQLHCGSGSAEWVERMLFEGNDRGEAPRLELAHGGTLLLEEIGELSPRAQARLLQWMKEGCFERRECGRPVPSNARLIATTRADLTEAAGSFRQDLFFLLNRFPLHVPPLRERLDDLPELAEAALESWSRRHGNANACGISEEAQRHLMAHPWPGNLLELENAVERAALLNRGARLEADAFSFLQLRAEPKGSEPRHHTQAHATHCRI